MDLKKLFFQKFTQAVFPKNCTDCMSTKRIKDIIGIKNHKLIYTSNATEANNLAIFGTVLKYEKAKIITTKIEHPSVYNVFKELEDKYEVVYLDVNNEGIIDLKQLEEEMNQDVVLVSVMWVNNIIGSVQPIKDIIELVKKYRQDKKSSLYRVWILRIKREKYVQHYRHSCHYVVQ